MSKEGELIDILQEKHLNDFIIGQVRLFFIFYYIPVPSPSRRNVNVHYKPYPWDGPCVLRER
jgi:hypothetical protein